MITFKCLNCGSHLDFDIPTRITLSCPICGGIDFSYMSLDELKMIPVLAGNEPGELDVIHHKSIISGQGPFGRIWNIDIVHPGEKIVLPPPSDESQILKNLTDVVLGNPKQDGPKRKGRHDKDNVQ